MDASDAVERRVQEWIDRLAHKGNLQRAHVVLETKHADRPSATTFSVHVHVMVKGHNIEATRDTDRTHGTIWAALKEAMLAASRQLEDIHSQRVAGKKHRASIARTSGD